MRIGVFALSSAVSVACSCPHFVIGVATASRRGKSGFALQNLLSSQALALPGDTFSRSARGADGDGESFLQKAEDASASSNSPPRRPLQRLDGSESLTPEMASVVKIFVDSAPADFVMPWQRKAPVESSGSGFVVEGRRIITNAHVVADQTRVLVRRHGNSKRYVGKVIAVAHDVDLALLTVEDDSFFEKLKPLQFGGIPPLQEKVVVVGYPTGGDQLSVTEGVVSRTGISTYAHSSLRHLTVQIDAAINPGNSGGPAICGGLVVGVAFQGFSIFQNLGYIIPSPVVQHFLADLQLHGRYTGVVSVGAKVQNLENEGFKKFVGLRDIPLDAFPPNVTPAGVYVLSVEETHVQNYFTKTIKIPFSRYPVLEGGVAASASTQLAVFPSQEGRPVVKELRERIIWERSSQQETVQAEVGDSKAQDAKAGRSPREARKDDKGQATEQTKSRDEDSKEKRERKSKGEETDEISLEGEILKSIHKPGKSSHILEAPSAPTHASPGEGADSTPSLVQMQNSAKPEAADDAQGKETAQRGATADKAESVDGVSSRSHLLTLDSDSYFPVLSKADLESVQRVDAEEKVDDSVLLPLKRVAVASDLKLERSLPSVESFQSLKKSDTPQLRLRALRAAAERLIGGTLQRGVADTPLPKSEAAEKNLKSSTSEEQREEVASPPDRSSPVPLGLENHASPQSGIEKSEQRVVPSSSVPSLDEDATDSKKGSVAGPALRLSPLQKSKALLASKSGSQKRLAVFSQRIQNPYYDASLEEEKEFVGLKTGDVLLSLGAFDIADDGTVAFRDLERVSLEYAVTNFFNGQTTYAYVLRDRKIIKVSLPLSIAEFKVPPYTWDVTPPYFVFGGFVFTALSKAMLHGIIERGPPGLVEVFLARNNFEFKKHEGDEVVVLSMILASEVSLGYDQAPCEVVSVNGRQVQNLPDLVRLIEGSSEDFITLRVNTVGHTKAPLVIDRRRALAIQGELLKRHLIPSDRSPHLAEEEAD